VLSRDAALVDTLEVLSFPHEVIVVPREVDLTSSLESDEARVVLLDNAAVAQPIEQLTEQLSSSFPDAVLLVAGEAREQTALAGQVARGIVYRFLHKPVSAPRIKLFLDAAWRRRTQVGALATVTSSRPRRPPPELQPLTLERPAALPNVWLISGIAGVAVVTAILAWLKLSGGPSHAAPPPRAQLAPPPAPAATDAALESLIARADAAVDRDALVEPRDENAADLYREAQRLSPGDPRVVQGLEKVAEKLVAQAQTRLQEKQLEEAEQLAKYALSLEPSNPRVALLLNQIATARDLDAPPTPVGQRFASLGAAGQAVSAGPGAASSPPLAARKPKERLEEYLRRAQEHMRQGALLDPPENSARYFVKQAQALAPGDAAVRVAGRQLLERVTAEARRAVSSNHPEEADRWISAATDLGARADEIASLTRDMDRARTSARNDAMEHVASLFNERLMQGRILDPASDSAKYYLAQLMRTEPGSTSTQIARQALAARMLSEAQNAVRRQDFVGAKRWIAEAHDTGADTTGPENDLQAAQTATAARTPPPPPPQLQVERTRYVEPNYPMVALSRRVQGTVDLQFTIRADGSTSDITIVGAQPVGVFEQAAIDAVRKWRYKPVKRDGQPTEARVQERVNFQNPEGK
jgi:protein TonB